ncbi:MAG: DUF1631 family protein [Lautropia sp.]
MGTRQPALSLASLMSHVATKPERQARTARQILDEIREPILTGLSGALRRAFASTIDVLLEKLLAEKSWEMRQQIDDALDLLRNGREGIEAKFDQACIDEWASRTGTGRDRDGDVAAAKAQPPRAAGTMPTMLSLLDDTAIGDQLTVGRIATRARRRLDEEQIDGLRARFGALLGREWFADNDFPIAPDVVLESLRKALSAFGPVKVVADLLDLFEPMITADLATLYAEVNALLVKRGVMPEIKYQISKGHNAPGGSARTDGAQGDAASDVDPVQDGPGVGTRGRAAPSAAPRGRRPAGGSGQGYRGGAEADGTGDFVGRMQDAVGELGPSFIGSPEDHDGATGGGDASGYADAGVQDAGGGAYHADLRGPAPGGSGGAAGAGGAPSMLPANVVSNLAAQVGQRIPAAQGSATRYLSDAVRFGTSHANLPAPSSDLLTALSTLQVAEPAEGLDAAAMVAAARATSAQAAREHGSPLERLIIETVGLVFEHVYEDPAIADTIKQQLLRLQVAAFKAALIDPSFFARPEHPMRRLIDRIAELGSDPDFETDPGSPMVVGVADVVTWVLATFDRDLDVFETAITRVLAIVEAETGRRSERLAKVAAAAAKAETLERTRDEVRAELLAGVDATTPEFVTAFITDHWAEVVSRIRTGADYAPFDDARARRTARTLLWSIAPKLPSQVRELASELPQLIADLSRGLSFVATSEAERELFFSELLAWHGAAIAEAKRMQQVGATRSTRVVAAIEAARNAPSRPDEKSGEAAKAADAPQADRAADAADAGSSAPAQGHDAKPRDASRREAAANDAVAMLELVNGTEIELHGANGESKRLKLGWMSPARTVFIFSRYPKDHWTVRRPMLNQLLEQGRLRVVSRPAKTGQVIESLKGR